MVPEDIRKVPRPRNTVVVDTRTNGPLRYAVHQRKKSVCKPGHNPSPRNGKTIGHIVDHKYVPKKEDNELALKGPEWLSYGSCALVHSVSSDLLDDLLAVFNVSDALKIMTIASLRVIKSGVPDSRLRTHYQRTFISKFYPGVALSANTVSKFQNLLGQDGPKRRAFYIRRMQSVGAEHHVAIDGTLKQDTSLVNDLSAYSRKARLEGCNDLSILYAYDIDAMEPICSQVFPGNTIDAKAYKTFIETNKLTKGIIIADKGFPPSEITTVLANNPQLHYLTPIKRNDRRIKQYKLCEFDGIIHGISKRVLYKKQPLPNHRFLYAFKDTQKAAKEENSYLDSAKLKNKFDSKTFAQKSSSFGVIVFESDQDLPVKTAYQCYADRWLLELVFDRYKNDQCMDSTRLQGDFSIWGSEFINFISTILTCRIIRKAEKLGVLDKMTYGDMMDDLSQAWRSTKDDLSVKPHCDDGLWCHTLVKTHRLLEQLEISVKPHPQEPKKRGRPRKSTTTAELIRQKRPRGRPGKSIITSETVEQKRPRGRPRKSITTSEAVEQKRPRGRPRKSITTSEAVEQKRPRGRPRKLIITSETVEQKRPRGRPRKSTITKPIEQGRLRKT